MADNARGVHVSPGVYSREIDLTYAVKSLGITTLGVAGETQRGPAFQPMHIENWRQFTETFGGTSTEKFKGNQYPKYELPYIAKSYLTESKQLEVVRVLGLSGYKAGPAWVVTANLANGQKMVVSVLRSRGYYEKYHKFDLATDSCECPIDAYDRLVYEVGEIKRESGTCEVVGYNDIIRLKPYDPLYAAGNDCDGYEINKGTNDSGEAIVSKVSATNYGRFTIYGLKGYKPTSASATSVIQAAKEIDALYHEDYFEYPVSLNPYDKDFILKVIGTDPQDGDAPVFCESLYDVALAQAISNTGDTRATGITLDMVYYNVYDPAEYCGHEPISGMLRLQESGLQRKNIGQRFIADEHTVTTGETTNDPYIYCHPYDYETNLPIKNGDDEKIALLTNETWIDFATYCLLFNIEQTEENEKEWKGQPALVVIDEKLVGQIFTIKMYTDEQGKRHYYNTYYPKGIVDAWLNKTDDQGNQPNKNVNPIPLYDRLVNLKDEPSKLQTDTRRVLVRNMVDGLYYRLTDEKYKFNEDTMKWEINDGGISKVMFVDCDLNNYASAFRYASTPWIVSNLKGDYNHIEINKLFRFHTISDGSTSNYEVKISIENIRPDDGTFDVVVRDINDLDEYVVPLEKFSKCTLTTGDRGFIGYKIGTFDGMYESKSKYITVEVAEGTAVEQSVPAGFLGYPMAQYDGMQVVGASGKLEGSENYNVINPILKYNLYYDNEVKNRKQYFGLSTRVGVDIDTFTYKGKAAYVNDPSMLTQGFHLDSRLDGSNYTGQHQPVITVDGEVGYKFDSVSVQSRTSTLTDIPAIGTEALMQGSIYEYVNLRKFTVYFYGGFDGWDPYRSQRTNTDDFKMSKYLGTYDKNSGEGYSFNRIDDPEAIGLNQGGITSDWYAYLAAYRQFANPEAVDINVFASPGIDYVYNNTLVNEVIDMLEEERADSIYVVTTPDKPSGAADFVDEMFTPDDAVYNLEDSEIDSNYTCTYYPWVKYHDQDNNQYIYLPATKDVVRNFAQTDNQTFPWFAPAGLDRGDVNCVRAHFTTKLADEDVLYEGRINPVKTFATDGVKIWGQKNLQIAESQLNRIAVRRLLLRMRKLIAIACRSLIFEPNDPTTKQSFLSIVTPIMDSIRANRGISDYRIEVNDTVESRDRRELPAKIYFKPYNALEYITLDFILTPEGVSFDNI